MTQYQEYTGLRTVIPPRWVTALAQIETECQAMGICLKWRHIDIGKPCVRLQVGEIKPLYQHRLSDILFEVETRDLTDEFITTDSLLAKLWPMVMRASLDSIRSNRKPF